MHVSLYRFLYVDCLCSSLYAGLFMLVSLCNLYQNIVVYIEVHILPELELYFNSFVHFKF